MSTPVDPARLKLIRAAVSLNGPDTGNVYRDRADLLAQIDWLNDKLVQAERQLAESGIAAARGHGADLSNCCPVVVYFGNPTDRNDFLALMKEANPNLTPRAVT